MVKLSVEKTNKLRTQLVSYLQNVENIDITITEFKLFGFYSGLRLTEFGNSIMKSVFDHYIFQLEQPLTIKEKVTINNNLTTCFYLGKNNIVIYDQQESFNINIIGDIKLWIKSM